MITCLLKAVTGAGEPFGDMMKPTKREYQGKRGTSHCQTRQMVNTVQELDLVPFIQKIRQ